MEGKNMQKETVDLLIENEKAMQDLYSVYAKKFPAFSDFWTGISKDEESHALWVKTLYDKIDSGVVKFSGDRFPVFAIKENIAYLKGKTGAAVDNGVTMLDALDVAVHNENGMLEKKFFEVFEGDSVELQIILEALRLGTEKHFEEVKKMWEKEKGGADMEKLKA